MLEKTHPDAILVYTSIADHRAVIETAAKHGVNVMVEKPLATTLADALAIRSVAREHKIQVLVNYETTWYASNRQAHDIYQQGKLGDARRVVVHDGHRGPIEIGVSKEFRQVAHRSAAEWRGCAVRFRLLRRGPDDVADERRVSAERDGGDADGQAGDVSACG